MECCLVASFFMFSHSNLFDGESSLPSICLCRVMIASSAMVGASANQMSDLPSNVFAVMRPYRLYQGDLALLLTDRHNTTAAPLGHFDLGDGGFYSMSGVFSAWASHAPLQPTPILPSVPGGSTGTLV
jgi:hypothetical protein